MHQTLRLIFVIAFSMIASMGNVRADQIIFNKVSLQQQDKSWALNADIALELNPTLEQLVNKGVTLHFVTDFYVTKSRWYWFDAKLVEAQRVSKISYQALTNQYRVTLGNFSFSASSLKQALIAVKTLEDWVVIESGVLDPAQTYQASIRMRLDTNQLAKPFQVNAINSKSWNLQSEWYRFDFSLKALAGQ
ncbi:MAG: hypothetical protein RI905_675 [Pseudomonadota bacterium]|jgi:hypothetical protein